MHNGIKAMSKIWRKRLQYGSCVNRNYLFNELIVNKAHSVQYIVSCTAEGGRPNNFTVASMSNKTRKEKQWPLKTFLSENLNGVKSLKEDVMF